MQIWNERKRIFYWFRFKLKYYVNSIKDYRSHETEGRGFESSLRLQLFSKIISYLLC